MHSTGRFDGYRATRRARSVGVLAILTVMAALLAPGAAFADQFRNGYWVYGAIDAEFRRLGTLYPGGPPTIGEPNSPELDAARGGKWQAFGIDTNRIYWNANVSGGKANQLGGLIMQKWLTNGDERGRLGYPTVSESQANGGRFNHFENGSIYFRYGATAAYIVQGEILRYWRESNWENGEFGFPVSDEYDFKGGKKQDFQRGSLYWNVNYIEPESSGQQYPAPAVNSATVPRITPSDGDITVLRVPEQAPSAPQTSAEPTPAPGLSDGNEPGASTPQTTTTTPPASAPTTSVALPPNECVPAATSSTAPNTSAGVPSTTTSPPGTTCLPTSSSGALDSATTASTASKTPTPQNRPFPAQAPPTELAPECSGGTSAPDRRIACTKTDWVLREWQTQNGRRVEVGRLPYTVELSARYGQTTTQSGSANWDLVAKVTTRAGQNSLAGGAQASIRPSCSTGKCGTGVVAPPELSLTPGNVTTKTWSQYANNLTSKGSINTLTGVLGVTITNSAGRPWSGTEAKLVGRCDSVATRTGCVNTDYSSAVVYDPAVNPRIKQVADHVYDAQQSLPSRWGNPDYNWLTRTTSQSVIDANRRTACPSNTADDVGTCDEFSLASTYQGASRVAANNYSTRTVSAESNNSQGGIMSSYYTSQRILDGDRFALTAIKNGVSSW